MVHQRCIHLRLGNGKTCNVSYTLPIIVTIELSLTIRPQFAIECLRRCIQQRWVTSGQNFRVFPFTRSMMLGSAESEHPGLTNSKTIFEEFQVTMITMPQRHRCRWRSCLERSSCRRHFSTFSVHFPKTFKTASFSTLLSWPCPLS